VGCVKKETGGVEKASPAPIYSSSCSAAHSLVRSKPLGVTRDRCTRNTPTTCSPNKRDGALCGGAEEDRPFTHSHKEATTAASFFCPLVFFFFCSVAGFVLCFHCLLPFIHFSFIHTGFEYPSIRQSPVQSYNNATFFFVCGGFCISLPPSLSSRHYVM
jgi:hypothetical protein